MLKLSGDFPSLRSQDEVQGSPEDIEVIPPRASVHLKALEGLGRFERAPVSMGKGARSKESWCGLGEAIRNGVASLSWEELTRTDGATCWPCSRLELGRGVGAGTVEPGAQSSLCARDKSQRCFCCVVRGQK